MRRLILDTSVLGQFWHLKRIAGQQAAQVRRLARELIRVYDTRAIVSPVFIEFVAGAKNADDLKLMRTFLGEFMVLDGWCVTLEDVQETRRLAERIPKDGKPRHLGDCLIKAMANRRNYEVQSLDKRFAR